MKFNEYQNTQRCIRRNAYQDNDDNIMYNSNHNTNVTHLSRTLDDMKPRVCHSKDRWPKLLAD